MDRDKAIRAAKLTIGGMLEKNRHATAVSRADGQIAPSKYMPNVPRAVHADGGRVTDTDEFRNWFGSSVTHTNGDPHVFYTGTSKDKDFTSHNVGRHGAWFTRNPEEASSYAEQNDSQGYKREGFKLTPTNTASRVIPAYVKAENPYTGELPEEYLRGNYKAAQSEWFDTLRAKGHDSWVPASQNGNLVVALKEPQQIKSIFNSGKFDPNQKHMNKATGGQVMGYVPMASLTVPRLAVARAPQYQQQAPVARFSESLSSLMDTVEGFKKKPEAAVDSPSAATENHAPQGMSEAATAAYGRLVDAYGQPLTINSAYRTQDENKAAKGAKDSQHTHGNAYDIDVSGKSYEERLALANEAWNAGFRGIGFYENSMHFDVGDPRGWGPSHSRDSIPEWAQGFTNERYGYGGGGRTLSRMGMYSKALEIAKNMQQTKGTPEQFMAQLRNTAGIKKAEIEAIGMPKGESITRDEFVKHISSRLPSTFTTQYGENPNYLSAEENAFMRDNYMKELSPEDNEKRNALYARQIARPSHEVDEDSDDGEPARTGYEDYKVVGGSNYRERLIRLKGDPAYNSPHWGEPNVLAHIRMQDRMSGGDRDEMRPSIEKLAGHLNVGVRDLGSGSADVGVKNGVISPEEAATISRLMKWRNGYEGKKGVEKKLLHVEEIQSDWAQDGRKMGFHDPQNPFEIFRGETGEVVSRHPDYSSMWDAYRTHPESNQLDYVDARNDKVSSAPYIKNTQHWTDLAMKNIMREAALGDYDGVVFTPGATQVERYNGMENPEGLKGYYDDIVPKSAMSVVQQHDKSIKPQSMKLYGENDYFHIPLTGTAKESIIKNGFPMFNRGGAVDERDGNKEHVMNRNAYQSGGMEDGNAPSNFEARPQAGGLPNAGGVRGGSGLLQAQNEASLEGLPQKVVIPMTGQVIQAGADPRIRQVARDYMDQAGMQYSPPTKYARVDPKRAARIASDYTNMEDDPDDPLTKASYNAMIKETMDQYHAAKKSGLNIEFWNPRKQEDPYKASPRLATEDVRRNHHMWVFPTYSGYGSGEPISEDDAKKNPLLQLTGETWNGIPVTVNDVFRAIHDYYGHAKEGLGFRADGEENAWRAHASMFSPLARMAMTSETRGQNSWLNYGPHGEHNRKARTEDTIFAPQKIGVLSHLSHHEGAEDFIKPEEISLMASIRSRFGKKLGGAVDAALALTRRFTKDGKSAISALKTKGK